MTFDVTNPLKPTITHDPDATLDYIWDFTDLIESGDSITTVTFHPTDPGLTVTSGVTDSTTAIGWVSITDQSLVGQTIGVAGRYTTAEGRTDDRSLFFKIKER